MSTTTQAPAEAADRALAKVIEQATANNLPVLLSDQGDDHEQRQRWAIGSRTTGGTIYLIDLTASANGIATACSCTGSGERRCWHRLAVRMAALYELAYRDGRAVPPGQCRYCRRPAPVLGNPDGLCPRCLVAAGTMPVLPREALFGRAVPS